MTTPKISVIIPCFNQAHFLQEAVASVQAQTFQQWECIIINDGSVDKTKEVALQLCGADNRIRYIEKQNGGLSSARNKGLDLARGDYIQFLDADDRLETEKFSSALFWEGKGDILMSDFYFFDNTGDQLLSSFKLSKDHFNFYTILTGWDIEFVFPPHCGIFKATLFTNLRFNENLKAREDWFMWLQIYLKGDVKTIFIDQRLAAYRLSAGSMSQNRAVMDQALVTVYQLIFPLVPAEYKEVFFNNAMKRISKLLAEADHHLQNTRQSESFRLGNFFIRNLNRIKRKVSS